MADPLGDQDQGGKGKRPAQTIEGTATEISVEPASEEAARAEPDEADGSVEDEADDFIPGRTQETGDPDDDAPPPRATLPELKSFVTHLAAGLLGGLIGVVGIAVAWNMIPLRVTKAPDLAPLENRLAKIETAPPPARNSRS